MDPTPREGEFDLAVLRIYHSAVVSGWRARDRHLRRLATDVTLVTAAAWEEGAQRVHFDAGDDGFARPARVFGSHPISFLYDPRVLWRALRSRHYDVIDIHEEPYSAAAAEILLLRRLLAPSTPVVFYTAQNIAKRHRWPLRWIERRAIAAASAFYPCSTEAAEVIRSKGASTAVVLPLGVDEAFTVAGSQRRRHPDRFVVGFSGRLVPEKGLDHLVEAMSGTTWQLDVAGTGSEAVALEKRAEVLGIDATFRGALPQASLPHWYASLDVLVVPSIATPSWKEQFGRVAVEAMAVGTPVVASAVGALPEVLGSAGLLVPPGDPAAIRAALEELIDESRWRAVSAAASRRAAAFTWLEVAGSHRALYDAVVAGP